MLPLSLGVCVVCCLLPKLTLREQGGLARLVLGDCGVEAREEERARGVRGDRAAGGERAEGAGEL